MRPATLGLLAPGSLLFSALVIYPILANIWLSFHEWDAVSAKIWIGFQNYSELFADPVFYTALANNLRWLALYMLAPLFGLVLALFVNQPILGIRLVHSLFFLPFVISQVVVGLIFSWFFNTRFGLFNQLLAWLGMEPMELLDGEGSAIYAVIVAGLWPQTAYCMILYLTGLASLDDELIDAARLEGAKGWRLFWEVVFPQLRPVNFIAVMVSIVSALRSFDYVIIMTVGGPYDSSTVLAYYMYEQTFTALRYGYGAAVATILLALMSGVVCTFLWRLLRAEDRIR